MNGPQYMNFGIFNGFITWMIPRSQYSFLGKMEKAQKKGRIPWMMKLFTRTDDKSMLSMFAKMPDNISYTTLKNCMKDAGRLYKNLENYTPDENAKVSVWYGAKEPNMKKAVAAIRKVYPKVEDHPFPGIGHGEILSFPEEMVREIKKFVEDENA